MYFSISLQAGVVDLILYVFLFVPTVPSLLRQPLIFIFLHLLSDCTSILPVLTYTAVWVITVVVQMYLSEAWIRTPARLKV